MARALLLMVPSSLEDLRKLLALRHRCDRLTRLVGALPPSFVRRPSSYEGAMTSR